MEIKTTEDYRSVRNKLYRFDDARKVMEEIATLTDGLVWGPPITAIKCTVEYLRDLLNGYEETHPEMFPAGKLNEFDEGALDIGIGEGENGTLIIDFGKPVKWVAMPPAEAMTFATTVMKRAMGIGVEQRVASPNGKMN